MLPLLMTTNAPAVPSVAFARSMTSLLDQGLEFDKAGLMVQSPLSGRLGPAMPAWGSAVVKARAVTVDMTMRRAAVDMIVFIGFSFTCLGLALLGTASRV